MVKKPLAHALKAKKLIEAARPDAQKPWKLHALKAKKLMEAARPEGQKAHRSSTP